MRLTLLQFLSHEDQLAAHRRDFNDWFDLHIRPLIDPRDTKTITLSQISHWQRWLEKVKR